jgi:hypothetical protein
MSLSMRFLCKASARGHAIDIPAGILLVVSTGAQDDLQKATDIARSMVTEYGMSESGDPTKLGVVLWESHAETRRGPETSYAFLCASA